MRYLLGFMCVLALGVMGCGESGEAPPDDSPYANKDLWLCRPDIDNDHCETADLSTTEIQPDGTMVRLSEVAPNPDAEVDCFYVYPSINFSPEPGNTEVLFPHSEESIVIVSVQAAPYRGACRLFAPLYHQMSEFTYLAFYNQVETTEYHQRAYGDVVEAFEYYMRNHNKGRGFILIGHSQGSQMLTKLLEEKFDGDETLRGQLVSALLTGPANRIQVLEGEVTGGSFANIPLCTSATETGCIIAFDANAAGVDTFYQSTNLYSPPSARACVNPASIDGGSGTLGAFVYPRSSTNLGSSFPDEVDTEWVRYPNLYTSRCADADEQHVLLVDVASDYTGEVPMTPVDIQDIYLANGSFGNLHGVEPYIVSTDLLRIVEQQIASWLN